MAKKEYYYYNIASEMFSVQHHGMWEYLWENNSVWVFKKEVVNYKWMKLNFTRQTFRHIPGLLIFYMMSLLFNRIPFLVPFHIFPIVTMAVIYGYSLLLCVYVYT